MTSSYLFYDIESTGLNRSFDQVLEFAAIRTDQRLNELERHTISVNLRPDVIPSPRAILTNRIFISDPARGICEYEATKQIHRLMNQPGTVSLGYNTLGFDDEFMRFSFHRNLLPPYTHQFKNGCRRMDLFPMAALYWLYKKDVITWPEIDGKPSLKLEHIGSANRMAIGQAHEAMVDVAATLELARRFYQKKKMWQYLEGYFDKETDAHRMRELPVAFQSGTGDHHQALMVSGEYGPEQNYQVPVISIGNSIPYSNQTLWLRMDLPQLRQTDADNISETSWIIRKRMGEPGILLPPQDRYWKRIGEERSAVFEENLSWLQENPDLFQKIVTYYREFRYPFIPDLDPDAALYQIGFYSRTDEKCCRMFHDASLNQKATLISRFSNPVARTLARRILYRNYPENNPSHNDKEQRAYMERINPLTEKDAIVDFRGDKRTTPSGALAEIKQLKQAGDLDDHQQQLLGNLEAYIKNNFRN
ncbi:MAG: exonuclease domain-containing protein [Desulfobacteraceae bacterium]|jgi:exodeoxyribonuclease-1|nr:exonuclease domain-containing protein [Desulfobacteraceae bacterium]